MDDLETARDGVREGSARLGRDRGRGVDRTAHDGSVAGARVLVLSASVGEGHHAAARALAEEVEAEGGEAVVDDGLRLLGRRVESLIVRLYALQLRYVPWLWRGVYAASRSRLAMRAVGGLIGRFAGRRLVRRIEVCGCDRVVSTYPVVSAVLASLRRRGLVRLPCATLTTDFDVHPAWVYPELDANFAVAVDEGVICVRPPVERRHGELVDRALVRRRLGVGAGSRLVLIVGGAWGVGELGRAAGLVARLGGLHALVVTGRNEQLRARLVGDLAGLPATVLGYTHEMPALMRASDVIVQNAGGVTSLEAFAHGLPVVIYRPIAGHGEHNATCMQRLGLVVTTSSDDDLQALMKDDSFWQQRAPRTAAAGRHLQTLPTAGPLVLALRAAPNPTTHARARLARPARISLALVTAAALSATVFGDALEDAHARATQAHAAPTRPIKGLAIEARGHRIPGRSRSSRVARAGSRHRSICSPPTDPGSRVQRRRMFGVRPAATNASRNVGDETRSPSEAPYASRRRGRAPASVHEPRETRPGRDSSLNPPQWRARPTASER